ncbi:hypothetical protein KRR39_19350 [Nocardioides panacis]|uniref:Alkaline shock response membrane anchor protein AmaP n=1 Tax=Nocardioides panacis TaxID=2849501 RepID=A0A975SX65_9ACTN|nr:hypothetical protein [Nocardioides panacis]QWZ07562.1 hypothetical protein KRR39_19350 [Nocardioides panacis]
MTRTLVAIDRTVGVLLALALVAGGLLLVDWRLDLVTSLPDGVRISPLLDAAAAPWWPFATAVAAVVLALVGLRWIVAHLPRLGNPDTRLADSSGAGRLNLDTASVARATAADLQSDSVLPQARGRVQVRRGRPTVQLDAHCAPGADVAELRERAEQVTRDMARAFPSGDLPLRVVVDAPRRRDRGRRTTPRVQ